MKASDWIAVAAAVIAFVALLVSGYSARTAWLALQLDKSNADLNRRNTEAAERANLLTERALEQRTEASASGKNVSWRIEHVQKNQYVLRNTGTDIAEHVAVDPARAGAIYRNLPEDAVVRPGEGVSILLLATWGNPLPPQLYVRWEGQADWTAVSLSATP